MRKWTYPFLTLLTLAFPFLFMNDYILHVAVLALIFAILAVSLGILVGGIRLVSLSQVAFFGIGAYTSAILTTRYEVPFILAIICSFLLAAFIGFIFSIIILRLKGHFLAMGTLAFGLGMQMVMLNWESMTKGPNGIPGIPYPDLFGFVLDTNTKIYYLVAISLLVILVGYYCITKSPIGHALTAIREDEIVASTFGIHTLRYKVVTFTISAGLAGYAGSLFAHFIAYINYDNFSLLESFMVLSMVIVGGMNHLLGPVVGAILLTVLPEALRGLADYRMLIYGLILVVILPFAPQGLLGGFSWKKSRKKEKVELDRKGGSRTYEEQHLKS